MIMKLSAVTVSLLASMVASTPLTKRQSGCNLEGLGQIADGQVRQGSNNANSLVVSFNNGKVTDSKGRPCYVTSTQHQFQCSSPESSAEYDDKFGVDSNGDFTANGDSTFYLCNTGQNSENLYTESINDSCRKTTIQVTGCDVGQQSSSSAKASVVVKSEAPKTVVETQAPKVVQKTEYETEHQTAYKTEAPKVVYQTEYKTQTCDTQTEYKTQYQTCDTQTEYKTKTDTQYKTQYETKTDTQYKTVTVTATPAPVVKSEAPSPVSSSYQAKVVKSEAPSPVSSSYQAASTCDTNGKQTVYPNLIVPVSKDSPDTSYGTQYIAAVNGGNGTSVLLQFDVPSSVSGQCVIKGMFPDKSQLQTSDYTLKNADIDVKNLNGDISKDTSYSSCPDQGEDYGTLHATDNSQTQTTTFDCNAGDRKNIILTCESDDCLASFFEDYNEPAVGFALVGGCP